MTISCSSQSKKSDMGLLQPDAKVIELYGKPISEIIFGAERVEIMSVQLFSSSKDQKKTKKPFETLEKVVLNSESQAIIKFLICNYDNYTSEVSNNRCSFVPMMALQFVNNQNHFTIYYSDGCNMFGFLNGKELDYISLNPNIKSSLIKFAKSFFPNDPYIRTLKP